MSVAKRMAVFGGLVVILATLPCDLRAQDLNDGQSAVLFRKAVGGGEIVCTAGPNVKASLLDELWGKEVTSRLQEVYEFRVDWRAPNSPPMRLWSTVFGVGKLVSEAGTVKPITPGSPDSKRRIGVMDAAIAVTRDPFERARMVLAMRSPSGGAFGLHAVTTGGEALPWWPVPEQWTAYDTPTKGDPRSVSLSISPDGLCRAEVVSMRRHTIYRQIVGKWGFEIERQWEEDAVRK